MTCQIQIIQNTIKMKIIKFLTILEKIIIILIILCCIPIIIFAYLPQKIKISQEIQIQYDRIRKMQHFNGFLTSFNSISCSKNQNISQNIINKIALRNQACIQRCILNQNCRIIKNTQRCSNHYKLSIEQTTFCSNSQIQNYFQDQKRSFELDNKKPPLSNIFMQQNGQIGYEYYCLKDRDACRQIIQTFTHNIQQSFQQNYHQFKNTLFYLMYFGFLPLTFHIVLVFLLDTFSSFNLRLTNSLLITHQALLGAAIILIGIFFNLKNDHLSRKVQNIRQNCLITDIDQCSSYSKPFQNFDQSDGISNGFMMVMGFILALQILFFIAIILINIVMKKYYQLRQIDPHLDGQYQLQNL